MFLRTDERNRSVCLFENSTWKTKKERWVSTTTTGLKSNQKTTAGRQTQIKVGLNGENIRTHTDGRSAHYVRSKILFSKHGAKNAQKTQYLFEVQSHNGFKVCVCVWLFHQGSRISQALVSPLRYPFILPEYHIVGADNWTWALFFYIQFKGKHFSHFQMARTTALKLQTCLYEHQSPVLL